ncbi:MAG TPA: carboxylating nicotinate-nucleotide diphosphorylase [Phycisphaerae bacterium]|nr:carboxylating nicotinate-nucleotide diphosphorylase [Phycisphaerae bacterium]HOI54078.1 carboxylating nicotinate-nucleotide diphosphorylase [Phycisphaerae bacterium]
MTQHLPNRSPAGAKLVDEAVRLIAAAIDEDLAGGDVTSVACLGDQAAAASIVARQGGVAAGLWLVELVYAEIDAAVQVRTEAADGDAVAAGQTLAVVTGPARAVLAGERTVLNFLQRLSGVATMTRAFVHAVEGTSAAICDTRKTTPGWRYLEKYAVRCAGGTNHRMGLYDEVLIKDNHVALAGCPIEQLVTRARDRFGAEMVIEVEVDTLDQLRAVLPLAADRILLDNMTTDQLREAVALRNRLGSDGRPLLEASGGVTLATVRAIAETGVDRISVGALTHSAPALDIAMDIASP